MAPSPGTTPSGTTPGATAPRAGQPARNITSGVLFGIGLAAFVDETVFHQLLHWHHFYDRSTADAGLVSDGLFHAFGWFAVVASLFLFADLRRRDTLRWARWIAGALLGAGGFQLYDGTIQHKLLGLHQIRYGVELLPYDLVWNSLALALLAAGVALTFHTRDRSPAADARTPRIHRMTNQHVHEPDLLWVLGIVGGSIAVVGYLWAASTTSHGWPLLRSLSWSVGVLCSCAAVAGPVAAAARNDFVAHMAAHLLLGMLGPLLLVLARPVTLVLQVVPVSAGRCISRLLSGRTVRLLTEPALAAVLNLGGL